MPQNAILALLVQPDVAHARANAFPHVSDAVDALRARAIATESDTLAPILRMLLEQAITLTGAEGVVLEMPEASAMVYRAVAGAAPRDWIGTQVRRSPSLSGQAFDTGEILVSADTDTDPLVDRVACERLGIRSMIVAPIPRANLLPEMPYKPWGVVKVYSGEPNMFAVGKHDELDMLARLVGVAFHDALFGVERRYSHALREAAVRRAETMLRMMANHSGASMYAKDMDGIFIFANPECERITQVPGGVVGRSNHDIYPSDPNIASEIRARDASVLAQHAALTFEETVRLQGEERIFLSTKFPLLGDDGTPFGLGGISWDITEQKRQQEALRASDRRFRSLADNLPHTLWTASVAGEITYRNARWYVYTGLSGPDASGAATITSEQAYEAIHPHDRDRIASLWAHSLETQQPFDAEYRLRRFDGAYRWQMARAVLCHDDAGTPEFWVGTATDIHDQKAILAELDSMRKNWIPPR